ncbi:MAG TPA: cytochrome C oxidase subunit IV family protein [Acidimicrobiia bacterium]|nr:cytochrome C oxidase subunit IV family protein [Acidimicrobiia bacterium]
MSTPDRHHPTPGQYWKIAGFLAAVTALEVAMFYIDRQFGLGVLNAAILLGASALKFVVVVGWFMHVRYEKPMISRFFAAGFVLACSLYLVVLAALGVVVIRGS